MRVTWCLPRDHGTGIGGYAMVYGYANQLVARGHDVTVLHLDPRPRGASLRELVSWARRLVVTPGKGYSPAEGLRRRTVPVLTRRAVGDQDAVIATAWFTAAPVARLGLGARGFYYIQHHETWQGPEGEVNATWRLPLTRLVIATWLADVARELDALPVLHLPNAIDAERYRPRVALDQRRPAHVAMLWNDQPWKRSRDGLAALALARQQVPELTAVFFSRSDRPDDLPDWVEWRGQVPPEQVAELLNTAAVLLSPSETEGWPLPPAEALACGCALVSTDIPGVRDYAHHGSTALLAPVGDVPALAAAVVELVRDQPKRLAMGAAGAALIRDEFSWQVATDRLESVLSGDSEAVVVRT